MNSIKPNDISKIGDAWKHAWESKFKHLVTEDGHYDYELVFGLVVLAYRNGFMANLPEPGTAPQTPEPEMDQVWWDLTKEKHLIIRDAGLIATIKQFPQLFEFRSSRPHGDGDMSYLCGSRYCRCSE